MNSADSDNRKSDGFDFILQHAPFLPLLIF